jgi:hypothetical protein
MKEVYTAISPIDGTIVKDFLEGSGIYATVRGEALWNLRGMLPHSTATAPSVWVLEKDFDQAKRFVAEWEAKQKEENEIKSIFRCPSCDEFIEGQFSACWNCGKEIER